MHKWTKNENNDYRKKREEIKIKLGSQELEQVKEFVYLGGTVTEDGMRKADIKRRLALTSAAFGKLQKLWKNAYHKGNKNPTL